LLICSVVEIANEESALDQLAVAPRNLRDTVRIYIAIAGYSRAYGGHGVEPFDEWLILGEYGVSCNEGNQ
jgi:hypothetical protein